MSAPVHLSRKLVLEAVSRAPDGAGGFSESWVALGTIWADIRAGTGREREVTAATISYVPHRIYVRAAPAGSPSRPVAGQRLVEDARVYRIQAVSDFDREGRYLECFALEEVSA